LKQNPNNLKFKKFHKPASAYKYLASDRNYFPYYGKYALISTESGKLTFKQIEAGRKSLKRAVKKLGTL
jgi:ribosomal protein L16/L10AE